MRFFLIDKITDWQLGKKASAIKNVSLSEDFFEDHFPLRPVMPGVLILEGMAQLSGLLLEESVRKDLGLNLKAVMTIVEKLKFSEFVKPGDQLIYKAELFSYNEVGGKAKVYAFLKGKKVSEAQLVFAFKKIDAPKLEARRAELLNLWLGGSRKRKR
jgi:3-hydroxyacyl-[acyl-carrier-protein] dehydratase